MPRLLCLTAATLLLGTGTVRAAEPSDDLGAQARAIFATHCYRCHGENNSNEGGMNYILDFSKLVGKKVIAGDPDKSRVYKRINPDLVGGMPDDPLTKPTPTEIATIKQWILAGAPAPKGQLAAVRPFFSLGDEIQSVDNFLQKTNRLDWPYYRFFSLRNIYNMPPAKVSDSSLSLYQAGLSKLLNSLSWKSEIVIPEKVDDKGIIVVAVQSVRRLTLPEVAFHGFPAPEDVC